MAAKAYLSIVSPVYNEAENVGLLHQEIKSVLSDFPKPYELMLVDDGSTDDSWSHISELAKSDSHVRGVKLLANYGQSTALAAGIEASLGEVIVIIDSDLQHDPSDIIKLVGGVEEGKHIVCGWRRHRSDADSYFGKVLPSKIFNFLVAWITGVKGFHDVAGGMRAFRREVVENITLYGELHRYLAVLAFWKGFKVGEEEINIRSRKHGKTKYGLKRLFRGFLDLITVKFIVSYSTRPLHIFGLWGLVLVLLGLLGGVFLAVERILFLLPLIPDRLPLMFVSMLFLILGVNLAGLGLLGELVTLESISSGKVKTYLVEKTV